MDRKAHIQGALRMHGNSQKTVALAAGVSEATVSGVVAGTYPSRTVSSRRTRASVLDVIAAQSGIPRRELEQPATEGATAA